MTEYGIFTDEGVVARDFYSKEEAAEFACAHGWEDVTVEEVCPDHPEHARVTCEDCATGEPQS